MDEFLLFFDRPIIIKLTKLILWVLFIVLVFGFLRKLLKRRISDVAIRYKAQKGVEIAGYILIAILILLSFTVENLADYTIIIGLFTAGITFTLQELILSIAGSFYIFFVRVYKPGDRIEINGIKGDVIDIDSVYTSMMEIGEWISSDNYSGRIVKLSNAFVFKGPVYNYSRDFPFVWDEFNLPIRYGSDIELAKSIVISVAQEHLAEYVKDSISDWKDVVKKYYIEDAQVDPTLAITMTDNWVQFNLRYIVDYKKRRHTKHLLNEEIGKRIQQTKGKVNLASSTFEIVKIPTVNIKDEKTTQNKR